MDNVDVVNDFRSEVTRIRNNRGPTFKFTYGDYLTKALIGSIDAEYELKLFYFLKYFFSFSS